MRGTLRAALLGATLLIAASPAFAEDRALLIGVATYEMPDNNLPGIDKDIGQMNDIAQRFGFPRATILRDDAATREAILDAMRTALIDGVGPNDRILIYFSGHGAQIPDEVGDQPDGQDDVLVAHDVQPATNKTGQPTLTGVVVDREIGDLLARSPSRNIILVVDACHSGTIDKAINLRQPVMGSSLAVPKFLRWAGAGRRNKAFSAAPRTPGAATGKYVSLSAAGDDQAALAGPNGSFFTVAIGEAVAAHSATGSITPNDMLTQAKAYISTHVRADQSFDPEIHGDPALREKPIALTSTSNGDGPNWTRASDLADKASPLAIRDIKSRYTDGETLEFSIDAPTDGYLNVLNINPDDTVTLLYPNKYNPENRVASGAVRIPTDQMPFTLPAGAPYGKALVLAIVTKQPFNLLKTSVDGGDSKSPLATPSLSALIELGKAAQRGFSAVGKAVQDQQGVWAAKVVTEVCSADGRCR
jgi:hypothetical protein